MTSYLTSPSIINANGQTIQGAPTPLGQTDADRVRDIAKSNLMVMASAWGSRPSDQCYENVADMLQGARQQESTFQDFVIDSRGFKVEAGTNGATGRLLMTHPELPCAFQLNHFSTGQVCRAIGASQDFMAKLAPSTAAAVMTERLTGEPTLLASMLGADKVASVDRGQLTSARISHDNRVVLYGASTGGGKGLVRCIATQSYTPMLASAMLSRLSDITPQGWRNPPARPSPALNPGDPRIRRATAADVIDWNGASGGGLAIREGDMIGPAGCYMSDRDMLVLLVNPGRQVTLDGQTLTPFVTLGQGLVNGIRSIWMEGGLLDMVCGNLIMWGVRSLFKVRARHVGDVDRRVLHTLSSALRTGTRELPAASELQSQIRQAKNLSLGATDDDAVEAVRKVAAAKRINISQSDVREAINTAARVGRYGNPRSVWGVVQGGTENSQVTSDGCQDARIDKDAAWGALLNECLG